MPKLRAPLLSLGAVGRITRLFSLARRKGENILEKRPIPTDAKTPAQLFDRSMFSKCVDLWHLLSDVEKKEWESLARPRHMTGYAWYISQCLRPNPGVYLPLVGGTMAGDIGMQTHRVLDLPAPALDQEAATKKYHDDNLPAGGYTEGARVYSNVDQTIPNTSSTLVNFNSEEYDTDNIHSNVTNNSRLTCRTAGKYLVVLNLCWKTNATGIRYITFLKNGSNQVANQVVAPIPPYGTEHCVATILNLAVSDYVEVNAYQSSGGNLDIWAFLARTPYFQMQRIG